MKMALLGQTGSHTSQLMHSSVIISAMIYTTPTQALSAPGAA